MQTTDSTQNASPDGHFNLEEIRQFQSLEGQELAGVDYYLLLDTAAVNAAAAQHFLFALELKFATGVSLLLSVDEEHGDLQLSNAAALLKTASRLYELHGKPVIQRLARDHHSLWQPLMGKAMEAVRLTKGDGGFYLRDAVMLDFGETGMVIARQEDGEGLSVSVTSVS